MEGCIFCKIVAGRIPSSKVYEDDNVMAFDDIHPMAPVHVIVIPKQHIPTFLDVGAGETQIMNQLTKAIQEVARMKNMDQKGFRVVVNCNEEGGQVIFHLHIHVLGGTKLKDELA